MKFQSIESFLSVAENLSFSKAAKKLGYSQAAITIQIKELEKDLNAHLFDRLNKTVRLTEAGKVFLVYAQNVVNESRKIVEQIRGNANISGELRIGIWQTLSVSLFTDILKEYHSRYPQVDIVLCEPSYTGLFENLIRNEIDMAYIVSEPILREDLVCIMEAQETMCFVVSRNHPLSGKKGLMLNDLVHYDFLLTQRNYSYHALLEQNMLKRGLSYRVFLESGNTEPLKVLAESGLGIAYLPEYSVRDSMQSQKLVKLDVMDCQVNVSRQVLYHKNKWVSAQMKAMFELILEKERNRENP